MSKWVGESGSMTRAVIAVAWLNIADPPLILPLPLSIEYREEVREVRDDPQDVLLLATALIH